MQRATREQLGLENTNVVHHGFPMGMFRFGSDHDPHWESENDYRLFDVLSDGNCGFWYFFGIAFLF
jgi:hypothetical protein